MSNMPLRTGGRRRKVLKLLSGLLGLLQGLFGAAWAGPSAAQAPGTLLPLFDAHLHYSHDAWERLPPKDAVALLRQAGMKRAMVFSSSDEGTQMLFAEAPDLVLPVLRPYRSRSEIGSWMHEPTFP